MVQFLQKKCVVDNTQNIKVFVDNFTSVNSNIGFNISKNEIRFQLKGRI